MITMVARHRTRFIRAGETTLADKSSWKQTSQRGALKRERKVVGKRNVQKSCSDELTGLPMNYTSVGSKV